MAPLQLRKAAHAMAVTFVFGRAGTGKTHGCLASIAARLEDPRDAERLLLIVPEQATLQMERALLRQTPRRAFWRAEVLSFSRLAARVFDQVGRPPDLISSAARRMGLRHVLAHHAGAEAAFGKSRLSPGFLDQLSSLIQELLRENADPATLRTAAASLDDPRSARRSVALADLFEAYLDWLGPRRADPAQQLAMLREVLQRSAWLSECCVWVDGFAGFTGQELETLVTLARQARHLTITLLLDPNDVPARADPGAAPRLFSRTEQTHHRLARRLADEGVSLNPPVRISSASVPRFRQAAGLTALEARLASVTGSIGTARPDANEIAVVACPTHREELCQAARWIRATMADASAAGQPLRFRDFALIARDLTPFAELVREVFDEYELPHFLDQRRGLAAHALCRFLDGLFETLRADFPFRAVAHLLRSELLPIRRIDAEEIEQHLRETELGGRARWRELARRHPAAGSPDMLARLGRFARRLLHGLRPMLRLMRQEPPADGQAWAVALLETLKRLRVPDRLHGWSAQCAAEKDYEAAELHRQAWASLCGVLEDLHSALAGTALGLADVADLVVESLRSESVGLTPPTLDQVLVGSIERSRHPEIRHAWIFGFNEGQFPRPPMDDGLLPARERRALAQRGLPGLGPRADDVFAERLLTYIALTRASQSVRISYASIGPDGDEQIPSTLLGWLRRAVPNLPEQAADGGAPPVTLAELARARLAGTSTRAEATADALRLVRRRAERLIDIVATDSAAAERLAWLLRGERYCNKAVSLPASGAAGESPPPRALTVSELETAIACPFQHFMRYHLRLRLPRSPQDLRAELGEWAHRMLASVSRPALPTGAAQVELPIETWLAALDAAVGELEPELAAEPGWSGSRREALFRQLTVRLRDTLRANLIRMRRGTFRPIAVEQAFGRERAENGWPAWRLELPDGRHVLIRGQIDRLDEADTDQGRVLLILDYKSNAYALSGAALTGQRLQLWAYALAVAERFTDQARLAGWLLVPIYPNAEKLIAGEDAADDRDAAALIPWRARGCFAAEFAPLLDTRLGCFQSPVAAMRLKNDGGFHAGQSGDVATATEFHARLRQVRATLQLAVRQVLDGDVSVAPLFENRALACRRCDFRPVCRFESIFNAPRIAEQVLPSVEPDDSAPNPATGDAP